MRRIRLIAAIELEFRSFGRYISIDRWSKHRHKIRVRNRHLLDVSPPNMASRLYVSIIQVLGVSSLARFQFPGNDIFRLLDQSFSCELL